MVMSSLVMTASIVAQGTPGHRVGPRSCARSIGEPGRRPPGRVRGRRARRRDLPRAHHGHADHTRRGACGRHRGRRRRVRAIDLSASTCDLLAPACQGCVWWQTLPASTPAPDLRQAWEQEPEAEAGFFGRALLEGGAVVGWMHTAALEECTAEEAGLGLGLLF